MEKLNFSSLKNNIAVNSWVAQFITFGSNLLILPILLIKLSSTEVALWFFFQTLISFAVLADSGFGSSFMRAVSYFKSGASKIVEKGEKIEYISNKPNVHKLNDLFNLSKVIYYILSIVASMGLFVFGSLASENLISKSLNPQISNNAFYIVVLLSFIQILNINQTSFLSGLGKVLLLKRIESFLGFFKLSLLLISLYIFPRLDYLFSVLLIIQIFKNLITKYHVKKHLIELGVSFKKSKIDKLMFKRLWEPTWKSGIMNLGAFFVSFTSSLFVAQLPNTKLVADFLFSQRILQFIYSISINPLHSKTPHLSYLYIQNKKNELIKSFGSYYSLSLIVFVLSSIFILFFGNTFLGLFIDDSSANLLETPLLLIFVITIFLEFNQSLFSTLYVVSNNIPFYLPNLFTGFIILLLIYLTSHIYGVYAILIVSFIVPFCFSNWYPLFMVSRLFKIGIIKFYKTIPSNFLNTLNGN